MAEAVTPFEFRHLRFFLTTVEHGSFRKAAATLRVQESAISLRGGNYGGRFSDDYDGRWDRPSGPVAGRGGAPTRERV
ncbi:MAG: LysR family transcriptional regulator [Mesorhizobium sp.]|nr:MAG: LysR family transcriptional regulator [Mesorhizobium sp.]